MATSRGAAAGRAGDGRVGEIMAAARALLAAHGPDGVTTAEIARRCGIAEGTIYRHFESKRDLLIRVAERWFDEVLSAADAIVARGGVRERLRQLVGLSLAIIRREPALTRFVLLELRPDPGYRAMPIYALNRRFTERIAAVLREGVKSGELRDDVPLAVLRDMIFGAIEHRTWAYLRGEGDYAVEETADAIAAVVHRGMAAAPAAKAARAPDLERCVARLERICERMERSPKGGAA